MPDFAAIVASLIDSQPVAFLGSVDPDGFPEIKAMLQPREHDGMRTILFSTNTGSRRVAHWAANPRACVYFCDVPEFHAVMLQGYIEIIHDPEVRHRLWREGDALYYPAGPDDPDYCVLKITCFQGRRYSNLGSEDFLIS